MNIFYQVVLVGSLDREAHDSHSLQVTVTDGRFTDTTTLTVSVLDANGETVLHAFIVTTLRQYFYY